MERTRPWPPRIVVMPQSTGQDGQSAGAMYERGWGLVWHSPRLDEAGRLVLDDPVRQGLDLVRRAAELGHREALDDYADFLWHRLRHDARTDLAEECVAWLRDLPDRQPELRAPAWFWLAEFAFAMGDPTGARRLYHAAADRGDQRARTHLDELLADGRPACFAPDAFTQER